MQPQNAWSEIEKLILEGLREALASGGSDATAIYQKLFWARKINIKATEPIVKDIVDLAKAEANSRKDIGAPALPLPVLIANKLSDFGMLTAD